MTTTTEPAHISCLRRQARHVTPPNCAHPNAAPASHLSFIPGIVPAHDVVGMYRDGKRYCVDCFPWDTIRDNDYPITRATAAELRPPVMPHLGTECDGCDIPLLTADELAAQRARIMYPLNEH